MGKVPIYLTPHTRMRKNLYRTGDEEEIITFISSAPLVLVAVYCKITTFLKYKSTSNIQTTNRHIPLSGDVYTLDAFIDTRRYLVVCSTPRLYVHSIYGKQRRGIFVKEVVNILVPLIFHQLITAWVVRLCFKSLLHLLNRRAPHQASRLYLYLAMFSLCAYLLCISALHILLFILFIYTSLILAFICARWGRHCKTKSYG